MWTKGRVVVVGLVLGAVALFSLNALRAKEVGGAPGKARRDAIMEMLEKNGAEVDPAWKKCQAKLSGHLEGKTAAWGFEGVPVKIGAQLHSLSDGKEQRQALTGQNLKKVKRDIVSELKKKHKVVVDKQSKALIFLYPNNMVVAADSERCVVTGLYAPTETGQVYPEAPGYGKNTVVVGDKNPPPPTCKWEEQPCAVPTDCCDNGLGKQMCCLDGGRNQCMYYINLAIDHPAAWTDNHAGHWCDRKRIPEFHGWTVIGCWKDKWCENGGHRTLNGNTLISQSMTINMCVNHCHGRGFKYAGLENSVECFCGNTLHSHRFRKCNMRCKGNNAQWCGGPCALLVYRRG